MDKYIHIKNTKYEKYMNINLLFADTLLILHILFVLTVVALVPLILIGGWRGWVWVRSKPLRLIHLMMIGVVVAESVFGIPCPLTVWENDLRVAGGDVAYEAGFIADWVSRLLYWDFPAWVFTSIYIAFGLLILSLWFLVPPEKQSREASDHYG
jgi:hypothetical protein